MHGGSRSQNHRITEWWELARDLCGSPSPTPLPKQGHLQQAAEDLVQAGLEYLQRRRLQSFGEPGRLSWEAREQDTYSTEASLGEGLAQNARCQVNRCVCLRFACLS